MSYINNRKKKIIVIFLTICFIFSLTSYSERMYAATTDPVYGIVTAEAGLNVRSGPSTVYSRVGGLDNGVRVEIIGYEAGQSWYNIEYKDLSGYVSADFIKLESDTPDIPYDPEEDFEAYLTAQGFPESYKVELRKLHAIYPDWKFVAAHTGLEWDEVVAREYQPTGRSLVHTSEDDSFKSMEEDAYNFDTGTYYGLDSAYWVAASKEAIEFFLDPRNSLDDTYIFQFLSSKYDSETQTASNLQNVLDGTFLKGTIPSSSKTYNNVLINAGETYGANPMVLASMILTEQGTNGTGGSVQGDISGYYGIYNHFNVNAYGNPDPVLNGLKYASGSGSYGRPWNTIEKSIMGGSEFYANEYVYNNKYTIYLKKWNVMNGIGSVGTYQYMTNIRGASNEGYHLSQGYEDLKDGPITFEIPVYLDMPSSASERPSDTGNNNNYLEDIKVSSCSITPTFDRYTYSYEGVVESNISSVTITPTLSDKGAKVTGGGIVNLDEGNNYISLVVTSSSGVTRTYKLNIVRKEGVAYEIGDYITKVTENTSYATFIENVKKVDTTASSIKVYDKNGEEVTSGNVGTGMNVKFLNSSGGVIKEVPIVIKGDTNGDGKVNSTDALLVQRHVVGSRILSSAYLEATDINSDNKTNSTDALLIQRHSIGTYNINF